MRFRVSVLANFRSSAFVIAPSDHGTMIVNRNDFRQTKSGIIGVGAQILHKQSFDKEEVNLVLGLLSKRRHIYKKNVVALDCGANIGVHTIEWARHMHGWGEVHAFEAQERIYYALAGNIAINNCVNARATWAAIGAKPGTLDVPKVNYDLPSSYGSLELRKSASNENIGQAISYDKSDTYEVPMITLDSVKLAHVDFIKIDVEGMEIDVVRGAAKLLKKHRPMMLIEHIKTDSKALIDMLASFGYRHYTLGINYLAVHESDKIEIKV